MNKQTTGTLISELGVRTVLALNAIVENHVSDDERQAHLKRVEVIVGGGAGVLAPKVVARSLERCIAGGHAFGYSWQQFGAN